MEELTSNSNKSKQQTVVNPPAPPEKVIVPIEGPAEVRKKNIFQRTAEDFVTDAKEAVKEVVRPGIKQLIYDGIMAALGRYLFKEEGGRFGFQGSPLGRISWGGINNKTNYSTISTKKAQVIQPQRYSAESEVYDYGEVIVGLPISQGGDGVQNRKFAEDILRQMDGYCNSSFGQATVADLLECAHLESRCTTDQRMGWTDFGEARAVRLTDGRYLIKTPKAELLQQE